MEQIVQQLGVTKPYVYYYFHNKREIFETVLAPSVACFTAMDFPRDDRRPAHDPRSPGIERLIRATIVFHPAAFPVPHHRCSAPNTWSCRKTGQPLTNASAR